MMDFLPMSSTRPIPLGPAHSVRPMRKADRNNFLRVFNHYVENGFAAYQEEPVSSRFFNFIFQESRKVAAFSVTTRNDTRDTSYAGFGYVRPYKPGNIFSTTGTSTIFLLPEHTGKGLGTLLLPLLEQGAVKAGMRTLLVNISSRNPGSLAFHTKHGFVECGRFVNIGRKHGQLFDMVWMQKELA